MTISVKYTPDEESPLSKIWPTGIVGELTIANELNAHIRVPLEGHTARYPMTALIVAEWKNVQVMKSR